MATTHRLLQISDLHLRADPAGFLRGAITLATLEACLAAAAIDGPYDAVLVTGDIVQDEPEGYAHLRRLLGSFPAPVVCLPGNHDLVDVLCATFSTPPFTTLKDLQLGHWRIVPLDSTEADRDSGRLSALELSRLEYTLAQHPDAPTLVALHHPPIALGSRWLDALALLNAEDFWSILDRHPNVQAVIFGHAHQTYEGMRGTVRLFGAPATCAQFLPQSDDFAIDDKPPGWRTLTLHSDGQIDTEVHWLTTT